MHPYPSCGLPSDLFYLPTINDSIALEFTYCRPNKYSQRTLGPSGSTLGLAPSEHLSQTGSTSILKQLLDKEVIERPVFSLMLINSHEGVLSVGGTAAEAVTLVVQQTQENLDRLGAVESADPAAAEGSGEKMEMVKRGEDGKDVAARDKNWQDGWVWNKVQGADGWWQILMQSVWVDGSAVLKNQAVVVDVRITTGRSQTRLTPSRSTPPSSSHPPWQRKPSTPPSRVRMPFRPLTPTSTPSPASTHRRLLLVSAGRSFRSCIVLDVNLGHVRGCRGAGSVWGG